jgi:hypothetical protein
MLTIEREKVSSSELTRIQLKAIQSRAEALWGDRWLASLVSEYEKVIGDVRRWFATQKPTVPSLDSFNNLLLAVGCRMSIEYEAIATVRLEKLL